jgi:hypothetical protein
MSLTMDNKLYLKVPTQDRKFLIFWKIFHEVNIQNSFF